MKVALAIAAALVIFIVLPGPIHGRGKKTKFCKGEDGNRYEKGESYVDGEACIRYTCIKKGSKLKMKKEKIECAVNGEWSSWSSWSDCSSTCGTATKTRERTCSNPAPTNGGKPCRGLKEQIDECCLPSCGPKDIVNVTALEMKVESLTATVESLIALVTKQGNCMSDFSSSDCPVPTPGTISLVDQISSNTATCSSIQATTTNLEMCLADVNSVECPSSKDGKTSVSAAIMKNKDDIQFYHTDKASTTTMISTMPTTTDTTDPCFSLCSSAEGCSLVKDTLMTTVIKLAKEFFISFEYKGTAYSSNAHSVIHFTEDGDCCDVGERIPGVWMRGDGRLHLSFSINGGGNYAVDTEKYPVGQWHQAEFTQILENGKYIYRVKINGKNVVKVENNDPRVFSNVKVYAADPWYKSMEGSIRNLFINQDAPIKCGGCSVGEEYEGNCYLLVETPKTWLDAQVDCNGRNGNLTSIDNLEVNNFLANLAGGSTAWIGASDAENEGLWKWTNGENVLFTNWFEGQPDNGAGKENCGSINYRDIGKWNDAFCGSTRYPFICQGNQLSNVTSVWSTWSEFSGCTQTCGNATKIRNRTCSNPSPSTGGRPCPGLEEEVISCGLSPCRSVFFIAGGYSASSDIELYHPTIENLTCSMTPPPLTSKRAFHTSFYHENVIYLCGGDYTKSTCISYSKEMNDWKTHNLSQSRMYRHSSVVLRNTLYLVGGKETDYVDSVSTPLPLTDTSVLTSVPNLSYKGIEECAVKIDMDNFVIIGGKKESSVLSDVIHYNTKTNTATTLTSLQEPRCRHSCIVVQKENQKWFIVTGGHQGSTTFLATTEMIGLGKSIWRFLGSLNVGRIGASMVETQRGVMVIAGWNRGSLSSVELLDWPTKKWSLIQPSIKTARQYFGTAVAIPPSVFDCAVGCSVGEEYEGNCYLLVETPKTWLDAQVDCNGRNGNLTTIDNLEVNNFLADLTGGSRAWIGASDAENEGLWKWTNGENVLFTNWFEGQPDNGAGKQNCGSINYGDIGKWDDAFCGSTRYPFICQGNQLSNVTSG